MRPPLILDVNPDGESLERETRFLTDAGVRVVQCRGPLGPGDCPLLVDRSCCNVDAADGVVFQLDLDDPEHRRILAKYVVELGRREVPIRLVVTEEHRGRWPKLAQLVEVSTPPFGPVKLDGFAAEVVGGEGGESLRSYITAAPAAVRQRWEATDAPRYLRLPRQRRRPRMEALHRTHHRGGAGRSGGPDDLGRKAGPRANSVDRGRHLPGLVHDHDGPRLAGAQAYRSHQGRVLQRRATQQDHGHAGGPW